MNWITAYRIFNVPPKTYLTMYVVPILVLGLFLGVAMGYLLRDMNTFVRVMVTVGFPAVAVWIAIMIPRIKADGIRRRIDDNIHFFITHMGVLATANLPAVEILAKLGQKREYGPLAEASAQIASLVRSWNMGLPDACRFVAERTPSIIFTDFLERYAYALETGEDLLLFLKSEQSVVIGDYANVYQTNLYQVDSVKEMFMSTVMSIIFLTILVLIAPIITGTPLGAGAWGIAGLIVFMEIVFLFLLVVRVPNDDLWTHLEERVGLRKEMDTYLPLTLALCGLAALLAWRFTPLDMPFVLAVGATPLTIFGYAVAKEETAIRRKDDNYPAFIRSLGASTSARGGSPKEVLKRLRRHDFGPLTDDVEALYRRLNLRLDDEGAWIRFANESGSNIIEKFTTMFIEGINAGGEAEDIGLIVSDNVVRIIALRKHRVQTAVGFRGMLLGLTIGMSASLYIGVGLLDVLGSLFSSGAQIDQSAATAAVGIDVGSIQGDVAAMAIMVSGIMLFHVLVASYMQTTAAGGSRYRMAAYVPFFMWLNALGAWATSEAMGWISI